MFIKKYFIENHIFTSLMGTSLAFFFMLQEDTPKKEVLLLIFFTYLSGYFYTKNQSRKNIFKILTINFILAFVSLLIICQTDTSLLLIKWLIVVFLGLLYNSFFLKRTIRNIPFIKIFYVGLIWGLVSGWLALSEFNFSIFFITFLFVTALVLPFDIRDVYTDEVVTFPKFIGIQHTKKIAYLLIMISLLFSASYLKPIFALAFIVSLLISLIFIYYSKPERPKLYFSFGVEMCLGLPLLLFMLLKYMDN